LSKGDRRGRDYIVVEFKTTYAINIYHMVVGFTTSYAISAYHH